MHVEKREGIIFLTYIIMLLVFVISKLISKIDVISIVYLVVLLSCMIKFIHIFYVDKK